jgi:hypothetical protein
VTSAESGRTGERPNIHNRSSPLCQHPSASLLTHRKSTDHEVLQYSMQILDREVFRLTEMAVPGDISEKVNLSEFNVDLSVQLGDGLRA